jgi:Glycosyl transferase family 2
VTLPDVTVVIPTIPPRKAMLERALASVSAQTVQVSILVQTDRAREGSAATRNRALERVTTSHAIFVDDDDALMPWAVQVLTEAQEGTGADVVSGAAWIPEVPGHREPVETPAPGWIPQKSVTARSVLHVTSLVRVSLAREAGGFQFRRDPGTGMDLDDYGFYASMAECGATFWRVPETVLIWHHHGKNTSGNPQRWLGAQGLGDLGEHLPGDESPPRLPAPGVTLRGRS